MSSLIDKRLVFVTGKGGTGKTTVSAALGLLAARAGKRTVVCEVSEQERLAALFGLEELGHEERELAPGLSGLSIDPERAKSEWLRHQLKSGALAGMLGHSRIFQYLTAAAPGLSELVTMGAIWDLAQLERRLGGSTYDLAIVDAPATGHGVALLRSPKTFADPKATAVMAVALAEEMPVNETIELGERLRAEIGLGVEAIVVNGLYPERFTREDVERMSSVDGPAVAAALAEYRRARSQRAELRRLKKAVETPVATLPFLFEADLGREGLEELSLELESKL
jgi:anion-transporting  ArsA/GET3 family ATPase